MATPIPQNRARFSLAELAEAVGGEVTGEPETIVEGVAIDSRAVTSGGLFVAVRGEQMDGAAFIDQALAAGASGLLVAEGTAVPTGVGHVVVPDTTRALGQLARHHRNRWGGKVIAITGSAGKTTTKELTAAACASAGARVLSTVGNLNNHFGVPMMVFMLTADHDLAVLELGTSGPGEIASLSEIVRPDVAAVILVALAHTEGLGSIEAVAREKASIWAGLGDAGLAVVNGDDAPLNAALAKLSLAHVCSFGTADGNDFQIGERSATAAGTRLEVHAGAAGTVDVALRLFGAAAAIDAACALACTVGALGEGALPGAVAGLAQVEPPPGRMNPVESTAGLQLLDDTYNSNPASARESMATLVELAEQSGGSSFAVLGDMLELGDVSEREHAAVGTHAVELGVSVLVGLGSEMAHTTAAAMRAAASRRGAHPTRVLHVTEIEEVSRLVSSMAVPGDVVLVKGSRGMRMERVVETLKGVAA